MGSTILKAFFGLGSTTNTTASDSSNCAAAGDIHGGRFNKENKLELIRDDFCCHHHNPNIALGILILVLIQALGFFLLLSLFPTLMEKPKANLIQGWWKFS